MLPRLCVARPLSPTKTRNSTSNLHYNTRRRINLRPNPSSSFGMRSTAHIHGQPPLPLQASAVATTLQLYLSLVNWFQQPSQDKWQPKTNPPFLLRRPSPILQSRYNFPQALQWVSHLVRRVRGVSGGNLLLRVKRMRRTLGLLRHEELRVWRGCLEFALGLHLVEHGCGLVSLPVV